MVRRHPFPPNADEYGFTYLLQVSNTFELIAGRRINFFGEEDEELKNRDKNKIIRRRLHARDCGICKSNTENER